MTATSSPIDVSIIIPLFNEEENIEPLYESLVPILSTLGKTCEIVFVNDGSRDATSAKVRALAITDPSVRLVELARNFGQTAAMMAGIDFAKGQVLVMMDGDGQNDPSDIPRLLTELDRGFDVVSGWRKERQDDALTRTWPSRIANRLISMVTGVVLHDYGCSLKAYRRGAIGRVRLYGEMHRFIPIYTAWAGGRITELPVKHHPRKRGVSKYGLERIIKVILDLSVILFLDRYHTKPIYVFGGFGLLCSFASFVTLVWMLSLKIFEGVSFILTPLPVLAAVTFCTGILSILMGLLAEMLVRTYFESQDSRTYIVRDFVNFD